MPWTNRTEISRCRTSPIQTLEMPGLTAVLFVGLAEVGTPQWLAALVAALLGGGLQSYLFKDLRYL
jgi:hypothetical protein